MKKIIIILILFIGLGSYGQEERENFTEISQEKEYILSRRNEINLNVDLIFIEGIEIGYERALNRRRSVGISSFLLNYKEEEQGINFHISPYVRHYFGKKPVSGFFVEGSASVFNRSYYPDMEKGILYDRIPLKRITNVALGIGIGRKWLIRSKFSLELHLAISSVPYRTEENQYFMARGGIHFGYQF